MKAISAIHSPAVVGPVTIETEARSNPAFSIRGGVPLGTAFDQLSILLSSAISAIEATAFREGEANGDPTGTWSAVHNLNLAHDLLGSMHQGYIAHRKQLDD